MPSALRLRLIDGRRDRRIGELILVLWLLSLADLIFTLWAHLYSPFQELNPIAGKLLEENLLSLLIFFKVGTTLAGAYMFWRLRRHISAELGLWLVVLAYVALAFRWSNYVTAVMS